MQHSVCVVHLLTSVHVVNFVVGLATPTIMDSIYVLGRPAPNMLAITLGQLCIRENMQLHTVVW